ncbi:hypothetical protein TYRP_006618 [Tyrophagus putrescentiae]|nr:hypothetical protein TYRP_006618 [Tyrophagus putrescentiae]
MSSKNNSKKQSKKQGTTNKGSAKASARGGSKASSKASSKGTGTSSSKGTASSGTGTTNTTTTTSNSSKANSKALKNPNSKGGSKKSAAAATTTKKFNFGVNADSEGASNLPAAADPTVVEANDEQLRMIVGLLEGVSMDFVTQHIKDDLDRIQKLVLNIAYREADERKKVVSVHFTEQQRVVIKTVCCDGAGTAGTPLPALTYPYVKLKLVPTRPSVDNNNKQKKKDKAATTTTTTTTGAATEKTKKKKG